LYLDVVPVKMILFNGPELTCHEPHFGTKKLNMNRKRKKAIYLTS